jgi:predicted porin
VTTGTLGDPRVGDNNDGRQIAARVAVRPGAAWIIGVSGARGAYLSNDLAPAMPEGHTIEDFTQRAAGVDLEYSAGYWLVRTEAILSWWNMPAIADLRAVALSTEARYKLRPGLFIAGRFDHLSFSDLAQGGTTVSWDAPVTRVEAGGGYYVRRNVMVKVAYQYNWRDSDEYRELGIVAGQLTYWF